MSDFICNIVAQFFETSIWEWIAFFFGVLQVALATQNKSINFYAGIISVLIYIVLLWQVGLYAESTLNIYYFFISILGIISWKKNNGQNSFISRTNRKEWLIVIGIISFSIFAIGLILKNYTSSTVPWFDALISGFAWGGSWLLLRRKLENWVVLNISNLVAIPIHYYKGLELTSVLTCLYFVIAIKGYLDWRRMLSTSKIVGKDSFN